MAILYLKLLLQFSSMTLHVFFSLENNNNNNNKSQNQTKSDNGVLQNILNVLEVQFAHFCMNLLVFGKKPRHIKMLALH